MSDNQCHHCKGELKTVARGDDFLTYCLGVNGYDGCGGEFGITRTDALKNYREQSRTNNKAAKLVILTDTDKGIPVPDAVLDDGTMLEFKTAKAFNHNDFMERVKQRRIEREQNDFLPPWGRSNNT